MGLSTVDGVRANAASWKAPTILPRVIHPKLPPTAHNQLQFSKEVIAVLYLSLCPLNTPVRLY